MVTIRTDEIQEIFLVVNSESFTSFMQSDNTENKIYKILILPAVLSGCET
jgi:hypothetical protein